jgi:hypothetical protein
MTNGLFSDLVLVGYFFTFVIGGRIYLPVHQSAALLSPHYCIAEHSGLRPVSHEVLLRFGVNSLWKILLLFTDEIKMKDLREIQKLSDYGAGHRHTYEHSLDLSLDNERGGD